MKASLIVLLAATCGAVLADIGGAPVTGSFEDCLNKDSISCLQLTAFRKAREFFGQKSIELIGGASLDKATDRSGKSSDELVSEQQVESAQDFQSRETAIEDYLINGVTGFFRERSLSFNIGNAARSLMNTLPEEARSAVSDLMSEGRGKKKKKALKALIPILMAIKFKIVILSILGLFGVALVAKKAILASLISLAISGFIGIKKLLASKGEHEEIGPYHGGSGWASSGGGWDSGYGGGYGEHGSHSSPVAQHIAYSGQKPSRR